MAGPKLAAAAPPDGSYQQTCRNIDTDKNNGKLYMASAGMFDRAGGFTAGGGI